MNPEFLLAPLLDLLLKSAALILLGAALLTALRKTSAANRHAVSVALLAALLLLPFTKLIPARWSFALEKSPEPAVKVRLPLIAAAPSSAKHAEGLPAENAAPPVARTPLVIPWKTLALSVWLGGAALLLTRRVFIAVRLRAIVRCSDEIEDERLAAMVRGLVEASGVRAEVRESSLCCVPLVAGAWQPVVLLPTDAQDWSDALISSALRHELGHIRRRDCITRLLADFVCALYWLNPLVWFAARRMRLAQEQACDDLVLEAGAPADEYAEQLVDVVRSLQGDRFTARHALAMAQPSTLEARVLAIVDAQRDRSARSVRGTFAGITFVAAALAICTAAQLRGADEKKAAPAGHAGNANEPARKLVHIEAKFVEITGDSPALATILKVYNPTASAAGILTKDEAGDVLRALSQAKGVDLLSAPSMTTLTNQRARIEVIRDLKYPTEWEKNPKTGVLEPTVYDATDVGVKLGVTTGTNAEGGITLKMAPEVVEFEGFEDLDADTKAKIGKADGKLPAGERLTTLPDLNQIPKGHRTKPVFNVRKMEAKVTMRPEQTAILGGMEKVDVQTVEDTNPKTGRTETSQVRLTRRLFVFVTARILKPDEVPVEKNEEAGVGKGHPAEAGQARVQNGGEAMFIREWKVPAGLFLPGNAGDSGKSAAQDFLEKKGIAFGRDAKAEIAPKTGNLIARNTQAQLDRIELLLADQVKRADAPPRLTILSDAATFDQKSGTLAANGNVQIETADAIIRTDAAQITPKPSDAAPVPDAASRSNAKADTRWIFPKLDFRDATVGEIVQFLVTKSKEIDAKGTGANILIKNADKLGDARVTLSLSNIPLEEVLKYVAALGNCELVREKYAFVIQPLAAGAKPAGPNTLVENAAAKADGNPAPTKEVGAAFKKAGAIVFPKVDLRDATISETVDFLRAKAKALDREQTGVNLILQPAAGAEERRITLSLTNVPLSETLRYVAELGGFVIVADDHTITLRPAAK